MASLPLIGATHEDSRASRLYSAERESLSLRESVRLLVKSWPFIHPHRRLVALKFLLANASLALLLLVPWPLKIVIDNVINGRPLDGIARRILFPIVGNDRFLLLAVVAGFLLACAVLLGMVGERPAELDAGVGSGGLDQAGFTANDANDGWSMFSGLLGLLEVWITLDLTQRLNQTVRTTVYERFMRAPLRLYADQKIGDAVFRVMYDSAAIGGLLYDGLLAPVMCVVGIAGAMLILGAQFSREPMIPIVVALMLPVVFLGSGLFGRRLRNQRQKMRERGSNVMAVFEERIAQVQLIKAFGQQRREHAAVDQASWGSYRATFELLLVLFAMVAVLGPLLGLLAAFVAYHLMIEVIANRITLGDVMLLGGYFMMLMRPVMELGTTWAKLQDPVAGLRRIHSVLDSLPPPDADDALDGLAPDRIRSLDFRDMSIGYRPAEPVLRDVSLSVNAGELTAVAGPSGAGKTTLIYSIPRFLEPSAGAVLANGADLRTLPTASLRRRIAFVFQQEALFSMTIDDNIRYGTPHATEEQVRAAAATACAAEFIERLPDGYRTRLGRRGSRLSVGQKQRIAIARALLRDPDIVVLDEPMAPLDTASEAALLRALRRISRDRIVIVVAHRAETLAACDRVHFLSDGTIAASGTHAELLRTCPAYDAYLAMTSSEIRA